MLNSSKIRSYLYDIGLSEKAATIYLALLEMGGAFPSHLASKTKINRSTTYKILVDLSVKGLVNEIKKGKKIYYQVEKPNKLMRYAKSRVSVVQDAYDHLEEIYPEIEGLFSLLPNKPKVLYFEGKESVLSIYEDHVSGKKSYEMLGFAFIPKVLEFFDEAYFVEYRRKKAQLGITSRGIFPAGSESESYADNIYGDSPKHIRPSVRYIPKEQFPFAGEITIYGDNKVSIINLDKHGLMGVIFEDKTFHEMMRAIFELAWKGSKVTL
jgi:predicted transcriptional regulator